MSIKNKLIGLMEILKFDNWLSIIIQTILRPNSKLFVYKLEGKEYLLNKKGGDIPGFRSIITSNEYRPLIKELKKKDQITLVDLGANIGGFAVLLDFMDIKIKKLIAVEYNPNTFYRLGINISNNFNCEYHLLNKAVVGFERDIKKNISLGGTGDSIYKNDDLRDGSDQVINGITIDQIYNQYFTAEELIDLIKIDIEGAEYEIFEYGNYKQLKNCKFLLIEIHSIDDKKKDTVLSKLKELCFEIYLAGYSKNNNVYFFKNLNLV